MGITGNLASTPNEMDLCRSSVVLLAEIFKKSVCLPRPHCSVCKIGMMMLMIIIPPL